MPNGLTEGDPFGSYTYCSSNGQSTIDYSLIATADADAVLDFFVNPQCFLSRHCAITTIMGGIHLNAEQPEQRDNSQGRENIVRPTKWSQDMKDYYINSLNNIAKDRLKNVLQQAISDTESLESSWKEISDIILQSSTRLAPKAAEHRNKHVENKFWQQRDPALRELGKAMKYVARKKKRRPYDETIRSDFSLLAKSYKQRLKEVKQSDIDAEVESMSRATNPKTFWTALRKTEQLMHPSSRPVLCAVPLNAIENHLSTLLNVDSNKRTTEGLNLTSPTQTDIEDAKITSAEIRAAIKRLKRHKAAGEDGISNEHIIFGADLLEPVLLKLFNAIFTIGKMPNSWSTALVTSIYKKGCRRDPTNYRPISVLPAVARLFSSVIREKIETFLTAEQKMSTNQIGNKKGHRTADHIATLMTIMQKKKLKRKPFHLVLVDLKNAFDTVSHTKLLQRLAELKVNPTLVRLIASMYGQANFRLKIDKATASRKVPISNGVRQGCPFSPLLFGIYIDPLATKLKEAFNSHTKVHGEMLNSLMYCDDLALFSESLSEVQAGLDSLHDFCMENKLNISIQKTKLLSLASNKQQNQNQQLILQNQVIESVSEWKYLGFYLNNKANADTHIKEVYKRCSYPINFIRKLASFKAVRFSQLMQVSSALEESLVLYASEAWSAFVSWKHSSWDRSLIERINFKICKAVLQVDRNTDNNGARTELGRYPLLFNIQKRVLKYWNSIRRRQFAIIGKLTSDVAYENIGIKNKVSTEFSPQVAELAPTRPTKCLQLHKQQYSATFTDYWRSRVENSAKLSHFYYRFKSTIGTEKYLLQGLSPQDRKALASFRLGDHRLAVETLRRVTPKVTYENRICSLCRTEVENEIHFLATCAESRYRPVRDKFFTEIEHRVQNFKNLSSTEKVLFLMSQEDFDVTKALAKFITEMLQLKLTS